MVSVAGLTHAFDTKVVLDDVTLDVASGEIVAIMGSSGGGKTTLLRCISGLLKPDEGKIAVDGVDVIRDPDEARRRMGMVFQSAALFDFLNVEENILFGVKRWTKLNAKQQADLVVEMLDMVGLQDVARLMPDELSGGMRKRVGIARALALRPKLMLYDEPTTGLDPITAYTIDQLIVSLRQTLQVTSIVVSHDVSSVARVAERIAFLEDGRLAFTGTFEEFRSSKSEAISEMIRKAQATELV
jgi:phospholipid/cholesterol/gamma-HCH transport system ATP-binding protein